MGDENFLWLFVFHLQSSYLDLDLSLVPTRWDSMRKKARVSSGDFDHIFISLYFTNRKLVTQYPFNFVIYDSILSHMKEHYRKFTYLDTNKRVKIMKKEVRKSFTYSKCMDGLQNLQKFVSGSYLTSSSFFIFFLFCL